MMYPTKYQLIGFWKHDILKSLNTYDLYQNDYYKEAEYDRHDAVPNFQAPESSHANSFWFSLILP